MKRRGIVPEFPVTKPTRRAGFIPSHGDDDVQLWQIWMRNAADPDDGRRATFEDMKHAGFKKRKRR